MDFNYNMKLTIQKNGSDFAEVPLALWRFRQLKDDQDAFDIACCVESVQNEILPLVAQRETRYNNITSNVTVAFCYAPIYMKQRK